MTLLVRPKGLLRRVLKRKRVRVGDRTSLATIRLATLIQHIFLAIYATMRENTQYTFYLPEQFCYTQSPNMQTVAAGTNPPCIPQPPHNFACGFHSRTTLIPQHSLSQSLPPEPPIPLSLCPVIYPFQSGTRNLLMYMVPASIFEATFLALATSSDHTVAPRP